MCEKNVQVTIIVLVFNPKNTLTDCIATIYAQSEKNVQIILVDECSSDRSLEICKESAKNDNRIEIYIQDKNKGQSAVRNVGIVHAKEKYLYFRDTDDRMTLNCIEFLKRNISEDNIDMAVYDYYIDEQEVHEKNKTPARLSAYQIAYMIAGSNKYQAKGYLWNKLFKHTLISSWVMFDEELFIYEDTLLCQQYVQHCNIISYDAVPKYNYISQFSSAMRGRIGSQNLSTVHGYNKIVECRKRYNDNELIHILEANKMVHYYTLIVKVLKNYNKEQERYDKVICGFIEEDIKKIINNKYFPMKQKLVCILNMAYFKVLRAISK